MKKNLTKFNNAAKLQCTKNKPENLDTKKDKLFFHYCSKKNLKPYLNFSVFLVEIINEQKKRYHLFWLLIDHHDN